MIKTITFLLILAIASSLNYSGCTKTDTPVPQLKILNHTMNVNKFTDDIPNSNVTVSGAAQNVGNITIKVATVAVNFFDSTGKLVHQSSAVKDNLAPGETWYFAVFSKGPDIWKISNYDLSPIAR